MPQFDAKDLRARIQRVLGPETEELEISFRSMFGGITGYTSGRNFVSLSNVGLALKLDSAEREALLARGGIPLQYEPGGPISKSSVVLPGDILRDDEALRAWLHKSIAICRALPKEKRKRRC